MKKSRLFRQHRSPRHSSPSQPRSHRTWQPHFEKLEDRWLLSAVGFNALSDVTLNAGTTMFIPLNSTDSGHTVNYAVTASDYSKLTPTITPSTNKTLQFSVVVNGVTETMDFQLFDNLSPNTTAKIESLVDSGFYNGLEIYRSVAGFVLQGGNDPPTGAIKTDTSSIAEEFNPNLQYTSAGILAMARTGKAGTSSSEFFITEAATRTLDYQYTVFGFQTTGTSVNTAIEGMADTSGSEYLASPVKISSASIITDTQNGVLELRAPTGATGTFTVTVTASDGTNTPTSHTFNVTIQADSTSNTANPWASDIPAAPTSVTYVPASGASSTVTNLNNSASGKTLQFQVSGVTSGNVVEVLADGNVIGKATATGSTVTVTTDGSTKLTDGSHTFTAIQVAQNQTVKVNENDSNSTTGTTAESETADVPSLNSAAVSLTVDTVAPTIAAVSSTRATGTYGAGTTIPITVTFSEAVTVTGTPQLSLNAGSSAVATYSSGSGTSTLTFTYTVAAGDYSSDLDYASTAALALNAGTIQDAASNAATLTLPATGTDGLATQNIIIAPTVTAVSSTKAAGTYGTGTAIPITVTFSEPVTVTGTPKLSLNAASSEVATYVSGSGTSALTFTYTVVDGDEASTLDYTSTAALTLNGGTIDDSAGHAAALTLPATGTDGLATQKIVIDTVTPTVSTVSTTRATATYGVETAIPITVTFSKAVTVTGTPHLALNAGSSAVATYTSGSGTSKLIFTYTVADSDAATVLDYASTTALTLNGGTIDSAAGKAADLTLPATGTDSLATQKIVIDTSGPAITAVSSTKTAGTYGTGTAIPMTLTFSGPVTVTGTPQLTLNAGSGVVAIYTGGSGTSILTFTYTVAVGNNASDLDYASITALALNGGSIEDAAGHAAILTLPSTGTDGLAAQKIVILTTPTVTVTDAGGTYNGSTFAATATVTGVNGTASSSLDSVTPTLLYYTGSSATGTGSATAPTAAGTYTVVASYAGSDNYAAAKSNAVTFTIATAKLTLTADKKIVSKGASVPTLTYSTSGLVGSDTLTTKPTLSTTATSSSSIGTYDITVSGAAASSNYAITYVTGTLTVVADDTIGGYDSATSIFFLMDSNTSGFGTTDLLYGVPNIGFVPLVGDWNGDGVEAIGLYDPATSDFYLRNSNSSGMADTVICFGAADCGFTPIVGDWTGDGTDTIGLYDPTNSVFYLRKSNTSGMADTVVVYGAAGSGFTPIVGDWNSKGTDTLGLYNPTKSVFYLRNSNTTGFADTTFTYAPATGTATPVAGDWNGSGRDTVGLYYPATSMFYLGNGNATADATSTSFMYGPAKTSGWTPLVGHWSGDGQASPTWVSSTQASGAYKVGTAISIAVTFSKPVTVTGTPKLALNAGSGIVASYASGSGTSTLTFTYTPADGDKTADLDYASTTALTLNGGTIDDAAGNAAVLTLPATGTDGLATQNIAIDTQVPSGYSITADQSAIGPSDDKAASFTFAGAEVGATYNYTVTSNGGTGSVTGTGTITSATQQVKGINVSSLSDGTLIYTVTLTDAAGNAGSAVTATTILDTKAPTGYSITADQSTINASDDTAASFTFAGAEVGATYNYTVTSSGGTASVTGTEKITSATQQVKGINVSTLADGTLTYSVTLTDAAGNAGSAKTTTATMDTKAPTGYSITADQSTINASNDTAASFTFAGAEVGATYNYTVTSSGGTASVAGTGKIASATQQATGINVSTLADGTLTYSVTLTDAAGNVGSAKTATATLQQVQAAVDAALNQNDDWLSS